MSILPERQQAELNKAVLQYLEPLVDEEFALKISNVLKVPLEMVHGDSIIANYLEKKWSTVLRLQRKILDLETELSAAKEVLNSRPEESLELAKSTGKSDWTPRLVASTMVTLASQRITAVQVHPVVPEIVTGCFNGTLLVWNMGSDNFHSGIPDKTIRAHTRSVNRIQISPYPIDLSGGDASKARDHLLATCSADLSIKIYNASTYQHMGTLSGHEHTVSSVAFSIAKPGILYSVSRDKAVKVWDIAKGICIRTFVGHSDWVRDVDVAAVARETTENQTSAGDFLLTCSNDLSVRLLHAQSGTGLALLIGHTHVVERVKFLPLISNYILDKILLDNPDTFSSVPRDLISNPVYVSELGFKYCVTGGRDNILKLWLLPPPVLKANRNPQPAVQNGSQGWHLADMVGHLSWVKTIWVHPNGKFIFRAGDDKQIKIWDLSTLETGRILNVRTLNGHEGFVNDIALAPYPAKLGLEGAALDETAFEQAMSALEDKMRCIFVSGGLDSSLKVWS